MPKLLVPIYAAIECHWCAEQVVVASRLRALIPKPGKPSHTAAALGPIYFQHPILKIVSKILITYIKHMPNRTWKLAALYIRPAGRHHRVFPSNLTALLSNWLALSGQANGCQSSRAIRRSLSLTRHGKGI